MQARRRKNSRIFSHLKHSFSAAWVDWEKFVALLASTRPFIASKTRHGTLIATQRIPEIQCAAESNTRTPRFTW
jgi:hypothetical protein